jgi:transketolase
MSNTSAVVKMRRCFVDILHAKMAENKDIWVVTGDLGYKMWDEIRRDYNNRFINVGAAEQVMVGVGIGLALEGKIPFVYSITSFLLYRPFESIRNYINREKIPVKLIGSGRNQEYVHDGFSHWAEEDREVMKIFSNINSRWPEANEDIPGLMDEMIKNNAPYYLNLKK